jgi:hypothetical protein
MEKRHLLEELVGLLGYEVPVDAAQVLLRRVTPHGGERRFGLEIRHLGESPVDLHETAKGNPVRGKDAADDQITALTLELGDQLSASVGYMLLSPPEMGLDQGALDRRRPVELLSLSLHLPLFEM